MGEQPGVMGSVGEIGGIVATICKLAAPPTAANWLKVQPLSKRFTGAACASAVRRGWHALTAIPAPIQ
jgi:hypothetical protein